MNYTGVIEEGTGELAVAEETRWLPLVVAWGDPEDALVRQSLPYSCGGAALAMTYRLFGRDEPEESIWPRVHDGYHAAPIYRLANELNERGFAVLIGQSADPWWTLEQGADCAGVMILNLRTSVKEGSGHYVLLAGMANESALLLDPLHEGIRTVGKEELLELWRRGVEGSRIAGSVFLYVTVRPGDATSRANSIGSDIGAQACSCGAEWPLRLACPSCDAIVDVEPRLLGCLRFGCGQRKWRRVYCSRCDQAIVSGEDPLRGLYGTNGRQADGMNEATGAAESMRLKK